MAKRPASGLSGYVLFPTHAPAALVFACPAAVKSAGQDRKMAWSGRRHPPHDELGRSGSRRCCAVPGLFPLRTRSDSSWRCWSMSRRAAPGSHLLAAILHPLVYLRRRISRRLSCLQARLSGSPRAMAWTAAPAACSCLDVISPARYRMFPGQPAPKCSFALAGAPYGYCRQRVFPGKPRQKEGIPGWPPWRWNPGIFRS